MSERRVCTHPWCNAEGTFSYRVNRVVNEDLLKFISLDLEEHDKLCKELKEDKEVHTLQYSIYRRANNDKKKLYEDYWTIDREEDLLPAIQWMVHYIETKADCCMPDFLNQNFVPPQGH